MHWLLVLVLLGLSGAAQAQPMVRPCFGQDGVVNCQPAAVENPFPTSQPGGYTYSTGVAAYTGYASPTDFFSIRGSATKTIKIINIRVSGYATGDNNFDVALLKRSTANTGGTPTTAVNTPFDSTNPAATATVVSYAAAPTTGTLIGALCACTLQLPGATGTGGAVLEWQFNRRGGSAVVLRGTSEMVTLNAYGASFPAGTHTSTSRSNGRKSRAMKKFLIAVLTGATLWSFGALNTQAHSQAFVRPCYATATQDCQGISASSPLPTGVVGASSIATAQVSVTDSATLVAAARTGRVAITVQNVGTTAMYCGASSVTAANGFRLPGVDGASITIPASAAVYCRTASGSQTVTVLESY